MGDSRDGIEEIKLGKRIGEGKTKCIYKIENKPGCVLLESKDKISANNAEKQHELQGKAAISNDTTCQILKFLTQAGIPNHFISKQSDTSFIARECDMIPIEWVTRRVATGSFLRRNAGVQEGYRFAPLKLETFYKDDAAGDPEWSQEQVIAAQLTHSGLTITRHHYDIMAAITICVFEVLERAWAALHCALIDMKIEFGVDTTTGDILLADVIDSDSWRLWPAGDRRLQVDKQLYRDMREVTATGLQQVKRNFQWVADQLQNFAPSPVGVVAVVMGSPSDLDFCRKIESAVKRYNIPCVLRVSSAHKSTQDTLKVIADIEGAHIGEPVVYVAVAGRSNGLGPVISGNTCHPVINCPPNGAQWVQGDIWSSLHLPSGLSCSTVLTPEAAGQCAANTFACLSPQVWARLRVERTLTACGITRADVALNPPAAPHTSDGKALTTTNDGKV